MAKAEPIAPLKLADIDPDLPVFLTLSTHLTGFSEIRLQDTGMVETYYITLMKEDDQETVRRFFIRAKQILAGNDIIREIGEAFIKAPDVTPGRKPTFDQLPYQGLGRRIIILWFTGMWTTMNWSAQKSEQDRTAIVSVEAYKQGLIWVAAQTHPPAAKQPGYGSWKYEPFENQTFSL